MAIPKGKEPKETFGTFKDKISHISSIGGVDLISIKRLLLGDPTKTENQTLMVD
jgi:hypothetical protein